jgi:hypothetical protein
MVESTVILSARTCDAELAPLLAGASPFAHFGPIPATQSAATTEIEIRQRAGFVAGQIFPFFEVPPIN